MKKLLVIGVVLSFFVVFESIGYADRKFVTIGTGDPGGTLYVFGAGLAQLYSQKIQGVIVNAQSTSGTFTNASLLLQDKIDAGMSVLIGLWYTYNSRMGLSDKVPVGHEKKLRIIAPLYKTMLYMVTLKTSGIRNLSDMAGKKVAIGAKGSAAQKNFEEFLTVNGLWDKITPVYVPFSAGLDELGNKRVDVAFTAGGVPVAALLQLCSQHDIRFIPVTPEIVEEYNKRTPMLYFEMPANTYKGQDQPVGMGYGPAVFFATSDQEDNLVYEMTKTLWENLDSLKSIHKVAEELDINDVRVKLPIPYHKGALRYYREKGLNVPQ